MKESGIRCPSCGGRLRTQKTVLYEGFVRRRRVCVSCESAVWTTEKPADLSTGNQTSKKPEVAEDVKPLT